MFATEHLKGWKPFDPVIDSGRSDLFLHTTHPFFILHFLRAADLSEKVFLTRWELMLTPIANCRKLEFTAFFTARGSGRETEPIRSAFTVWHHKISNSMVWPVFPTRAVLLPAQ